VARRRDGRGASLRWLGSSWLSRAQPHPPRWSSSRLPSRDVATASLSAGSVAAGRPRRSCSALSRRRSRRDGAPWRRGPVAPHRNRSAETRGRRRVARHGTPVHGNSGFGRGPVACRAPTALHPPSAPRAGLRADPRRRARESGGAQSAPRALYGESRFTGVTPHLVSAHNLVAFATDRATRLLFSRSPPWPPSETSPTP